MANIPRPTNMGLNVWDALKVISDFNPLKHFGCSSCRLGIVLKNTKL